jgi:hypothetical protein
VVSEEPQREIWRLLRLYTHEDTVNKRYYPDIWVTLVDGNPLLAELTASALDIIERKFPSLVLDQLTGIKHYTQLQ